MHDRVSILGLLHPTGAPRGVAVLGDGLPELMVGVESATAGPDVTVIAPRRAVGRSWLERAATTAAQACDDDGLVLVVERPLAGHRVGPRLRHHGLVEAGTTLVVTPGGQLASAEPTALSVALARRSRARALVAAERTLGHLPLWALGALTTTVTAYGRHPASLAAWLREPGGTEDDALVLTPSWRGTTGTVVVARVGRDGASLIGKVGLGGDSASAGPDEVAALRLLGDDARADGVAVPRPLGLVDLSGRQAAILTVVPGNPAALEPTAAAAVAERVTTWLARWLDRTLHEVPAADVLEEAVLRPLGLVMGVVGAEWAEQARRRVAQLGSRAIGVTAAHNDLTLWNVLSDESGLAVVDWQGATGRALPLVDLPYLLVDAVACADRLGDRRDAYRACFAPDGARRAWTAGLVAQAAGRGEVPPDLLELSFDACWLGHAADELSRGAAATPFLDVLAQHAGALR